MHIPSAFTVLAAGVLAALSVPASAQITETFIDFEAPGFDATSGSAVGDAGFDFFFASSGGLVPTEEDPNPPFQDFTGFIPANPNLNVEAPSIVTVAFDDAALSGNQSLVFFTDVNSGLFLDNTPGDADPNVEDPRTLLLSVFQQQTISAADIGTTVIYSFDFAGGSGAVNTAEGTFVEAFLLTIDPNSGFVVTNDIGFDLSGAAEAELTSGQLTLDLSDAALEGQTLQFGFRNGAADGQNPAVILDNLSLTVPEPSTAAVLAAGGFLLARRRRSA